MDADAPAPGPYPDEVQAEVTVEGACRVRWSPRLTERGLHVAVDTVRDEVVHQLRSHSRVESLLAPDDQEGQRIATWAGLRREGLRRGLPGHAEEEELVDRVVYARVVTDEDASDPQAFRALLNSFLPRKRAIAQLLLRDEQDRVLLCRLTYKEDWDLPGGVVEVGESPRLAVAREVEEELGLVLDPRRLLLTDWMPAWGGWDDAVCLVFDGGAHDASLPERIVRDRREIAHAEFCTRTQVRERAADFTARRVEAALSHDGSSYTESGRPA